MGPNAVHLEVDVHATNGRKHGLKEDEWIPYLTISYTIEKVGTKFKNTGGLLAMTAKDGLHYANNVALTGDGGYRLTCHFKPPSNVMLTRKAEYQIGGSRSRRAGLSITRAKKPTDRDRYARINLVGLPSRPRAIAPWLKCAADIRC